jgi:hypothetical protein
VSRVLIAQDDSKFWGEEPLNLDETELRKEVFGKNDNNRMEGVYWVLLYLNTPRDSIPNVRSLTGALTCTPKYRMGLPTQKTYDRLVEHPMEALVGLLWLKVRQEASPLMRRTRNKPYRMTVGGCVFGIVHAPVRKLLWAHYRFCQRPIESLLNCAAPYTNFWCDATTAKDQGESPSSYVLLSR